MSVPEEKLFETPENMVVVVKNYPSPCTQGSPGRLHDCGVLDPFLWIRGLPCGETLFVLGEPEGSGRVHVMVKYPDSSEMNLRVGKKSLCKPDGCRFHSWGRGTEYVAGEP